MSGTTRTTVATTTTTVEGTYLEKRDKAPIWPLLLGAAGLVGVGLLHALPIRHSMEDDLEARTVSQVLSSSGLTDAKVDFTGQDGVVTGTAPAGADVAALTADITNKVLALDGVRVVEVKLTPAGGGGGGTSPSPAPSASPTDTTPTSSPTNEPTTQPSVSPSQGGTSASPSESASPAKTAGELPAVNGVITKGKLVLTGTVPSQDAAKALVAEAENTFGAGSVVNQLTVKDGVSDEGLAKLGPVFAALGKGSEATVDLKGGTLTLSGSVVSDDIKKAAIAAAGQATGDPAKVVDQLKVSDLQTKLNNLPPIQFQTAYSTLTPAGYQIVQQAAALLKQYPDAKVQIQGHTDDVGSPSVNQELSVARGQQVREALRQLGISDDRMSYAGFGASKPKVPNTSAGNRAINRRVEFVVL